MGANLDSSGSSANLGPFYMNQGVHTDPETAGIQGTGKVGAQPSVDKTTTDVVEGYQGTGRESKVPPPEHPSLPHSNAMPQDAAAAGNAWLDTTAITAFYSAMRDTLKAKQDQMSQESKLMGANMTSIIETGAEKAASQMTKAVEEAINYGISAVASGVQAANSTKGLVDRVKIQNDSEAKAKAAESDPNRGLTPAQQKEMGKLDAQIAAKKNELHQIDNTAAGDKPALTQQQQAKKESCEAEIARLEDKKAQIVQSKESNVAEEQKAAQRERSDNLSTVEIRTQAINQFAQGAEAAAKAPMALLMGMEDKEQTLLDTQNQINQASLEAAGKGYDAGHQDFSSIVEAMNQFSRNQAQSIKFTAA